MKSILFAMQLLLAASDIGDPCSKDVYPWTCGRYECCGSALIEQLESDKSGTSPQIRKSMCNINGANQFIEPQDSRIRYPFTCFVPPVEEESSATLGVAFSMLVLAVLSLSN